MIKGDLLMIVLSEREPTKMNGVLARASAHCARSAQALVFDLSAKLSVNMPALRDGLLGIEATKPLALSVIVALEHLGQLRAISFEAAHRGWVLGAFAQRDAAIAHALRERRLALAEPCVAASSASMVERVRSISA